MILIGRYLSPFVRRSATVLKTLGLEFERKELSTADDKDEIMAINPVGRVPALILDGGEAIVDSHAIIDHALETGDPDGRLMPKSGPERRAVLRTSIIAVGAMEKAVVSSYERNRRPEDKIWDGWWSAAENQAASALKMLDTQAAAAGDWLHGDHMTLADVDATIARDFVRIACKHMLEGDPYPALTALAARCDALPAFDETQWRG